VNDTHVLAPNLINTMTFGFHRHALQRYDVSVGREPWGTVLGGVKNAHNADAHFPDVVFLTDNYSGADTHYIVDRGTDVYGLDNSLSWIKRNHNLQFGYSLNIMLYQEDTGSFVAGTNSFHRLGTSRPTDNSGRTGNSFASRISCRRSLDCRVGDPVPEFRAGCRSYAAARWRPVAAEPESNGGNHQPAKQHVVAPYPTGDLVPHARLVWLGEIRQPECAVTNRSTREARAQRSQWTTVDPPGAKDLSWRRRGRPEFPF
jgi:hypothetical protein